MLGEFEVRAELAVLEDGEAEPGTQGDDDLHAGAGDDVEALEVGVVDDPHGPTEAPGERGAEVESIPGRDQFLVLRAAWAVDRDEVRC